MTKSQEYPRCRTCGRTKKPIGRDMPAGGPDMCANARDGFGCEGWLEEPYPVSWWPGEDRNS